jgi:MFS family permease
MDDHPLETSRSPVEASAKPLRVSRWRDPPILGLAAVALAAGFGQFGAVAALGDVARSFGHVTTGATVADRAGLSGTELGAGLAILHLASLAALPATSMADRFGRRRVLLTSCGVGLALIVCSAASPGYWWFVAIFALGGMSLSATAAVAQVGAAEETSADDRAKAVALIAGAYGVGSGLTAVIYGLLSGSIGFRGLFALAAIPAVLLPVLGRAVVEPDRFTRAVDSGERATPVLGAVAAAYRTRLIIVSLLAFSISVVTGPANSFLYVYAQNVVGLTGLTISLMVTAAGAFGLAGLLVGRWLADNVGRRPTAAGAIIGVVVCGCIAYSGSTIGVVGGYVVGILAASTFAPAGGALVNELFPTSVRASVAGWQVGAGVLGAVTGLVVFGAVADIGNQFGVAALVTFTPVIAMTALFILLPETKGTEPEDLWPDEPAQGAARGRAASGTGDQRG